MEKDKTTSTLPYKDLKNGFSVTQDGETLNFMGVGKLCYQDYLSEQDPTETFFDWCKNSYDQLPQTTSTEQLKENELQALRNALESFNLKGYEVYRDANAKKATYCFVHIDKNVLTGWWNYDRMNHFILGYGKANEKLSSENKVLREALDRLNKAIGRHLYLTSDETGNQLTAASLRADNILNQ